MIYGSNEMGEREVCGRFFGLLWLSLGILLLRLIFFSFVIRFLLNFIIIFCCVNKNSYWYGVWIFFYIKKGY